MSITYTAYLLQYIKIFLLYIAAFTGIVLWFMTERSIALFFLILIIGWFLSIAGTIGWHRWLSHRSFNPSWYGKYLMLAGLLVEGFGNSIHIVVAHRLHHKFHDTLNDPHSAATFSYMDFLKGKWIVAYRSNIKKLPPLKDILKMKDVVWFSTHYWKIWWTFNILLACIDWQIALIFCPVIFARSWIIGQSMNYFGHGGKVCRPTNLEGSILSFITIGESLHKNHHDSPASWRWDTKNSSPDFGGMFIKTFLIDKSK